MTVKTLAAPRIQITLLECSDSKTFKKVYTFFERLKAVSLQAGFSYLTNRYTSF